MEVESSVEGASAGGGMMGRFVGDVGHANLTSTVGAARESLLCRLCGPAGEVVRVRALEHARSLGRYCSILDVLGTDPARLVMLPGPQGSSTSAIWEAMNTHVVPKMTAHVRSLVEGHVSRLRECFPPSDEASREAAFDEFYGQCVAGVGEDWAEERDKAMRPCVRLWWEAFMVNLVMECHLEMRDCPDPLRLSGQPGQQQRPGPTEQRLGQGPARRRRRRNRSRRSRASKSEEVPRAGASEKNKIYFKSPANFLTSRLQNEGTSRCLLMFDCSKWLCPQGRRR